MKFAVGHNSPETIVVLEKREAKSLLDRATQISPQEKIWLREALEDFTDRDCKVILRLTEYLEMVGRR